MNCKFRSLRADEVEVRVSQIGKTSTQLLLYKDARCDMNILDETVGPENWQRGHTRDNANCTVSIWDDNKAQWISKEDTGTESNTEREKGLASDSFKRACVNWGIGRELYTAGRIFVKNDDLEFYEKNGKQYIKNGFDVAEMVVVEGVITDLVIKTEKGKTVFTKHKPQPKGTDVNNTNLNQPVCTDCGCAITPSKTRTVQQMAHASKTKYGRVLCVNCATEESARLDSQIA